MTNPKVMRTWASSAAYCLSQAEVAAQTADTDVTACEMACRHLHDAARCLANIANAHAKAMNAAAQQANEVEASAYSSRRTVQP